MGLFLYIAMYHVYVLYSLKDHRLYKGVTSDIAARLQRHNTGGNASTAKRKPFVLVHLETFDDKSAALKRERYIKSKEGGAALKDYLWELNIIKEDGKLGWSSW